VLQIDDDRFRRGDFVELGIIMDYVEKYLYVWQTDRDDSTFHWTFNTVWVCSACGNRMVDERSTCLDVVTMPADCCQMTVQGGLDTFSNLSTRKRQCKKCYYPTRVCKLTTTYPNVLFLKYPTIDGKGDLKMPDIVDKVVTIGEDVIYDIAGAVYAGNSHFITRYVRDGKVFEADGMLEHPTHYHPKRRAAFSVEILGPYEESFAGHINWTLDSSNKKTGGKKATDIYYTKRI
jgi:hypothetical protein